MTGLQVAACVVVFVTPWMFTLTASVKRAGDVGICTAGAGVCGLLTVGALARLVALDFDVITREVAVWLVSVSTSLLATGLLLFGAAAWSRRWHIRQRQAAVAREEDR